MEDVHVVEVPWADPDAAALRAEQQAGLAELYDGTEDIEPDLPPDEMVHTVLVRAGGEPVATGSLRVGEHLPPGTGELKRMYVRPPWRGRGLSRLVLAGLEEAAVARGLRRLILETGLRQTAAVGLYRSAGYRRIPNFGIYAEEPTSVCYGRWLDPSDVVRVLVVNGTVGAGKTTVADRVGAPAARPRDRQRRARRRRAHRRQAGARRGPVPPAPGVRGARAAGPAVPRARAAPRGAATGGRGPGRPRGVRARVRRR